MIIRARSAEFFFFFFLLLAGRERPSSMSLQFNYHLHSSLTPFSLFHHQQEWRFDPRAVSIKVFGSENYVTKLNLFQGKNWRASPAGSATLAIDSHGVYKAHSRVSKALHTDGRPSSRFHTSVSELLFLHFSIFHLP